MEVKGSDVNLAVHLLNDAWRDLFNAGAVISNDTNLVTPIQMVTVERRKPVYVVCPGKWQLSPVISGQVCSVRRRSLIQFPAPPIRKPPTW
jgi:hypothetical protein